MKRVKFVGGWSEINHRLRQDTAGVAAVEFAFILPVFMLLLFGAAVFGLLFGLSLSLQQISADVSRYAMVGLDGSERADLARQAIQSSSADYPLIDPALLSYRLSESGTWMTLTVSYDISGYRIPALVSDFLRHDDRLERSATVVLP